ncbi:MAG: tRNA 2-thiouridine(34) synthase MnmA [Actinomycetota bacterium]
MKPKAVVAMSGGVDSSVAAALMKDAGYDVTGVMMKLWKGAAANNESGCCSVDAAEDARRVAQVLDIPFYVFNFADHFSDTVIADFKSEYAKGRTPNPCIQCNRSVKFQMLAERARSYGAVALATGHYARVDEAGGEFRLHRGKDADKDQSYVLYMLDQAELQLARFPVGEYRKAEIREIASSLDLRVAGKAESQEICFVPEGDSHAFISEQVPAGSKPGAVLTASGKRVGTHRGFAHYTVGQRRGLGFGVGMPLYVREIRAEDNVVVVTEREGATVTEMQLEDSCLVSGKTAASFQAAVMTRYRGPEVSATVELAGSRARVEFDEPQFPPAPGQAAVFYDHDEVLGGGTICSSS